MTQQHYAELRGKKQSAIAHHINAYRVKQAISKSITTVIDFSVRAARDIASLDESDWTWFGKLCLDREWGEKERQAAIKAVKVIDIPEVLQHWLNPDKWKREVALDAVDPDSKSLLKGEVRYCR